ncbi:LRR-GTPase of the ROCO family, incomplete sequence [Ectocarpus siliculosus]|uniref:LRR-GTPase of the ROCO family, incomplete sequence n=1 Tax=Ectocarpus siliculosus TaxID=2880 RepID=D7FUH6_ECTSI|nr:LRR-GTPase of the ROCO family, incomplete sequence [Ectocarpus siliculosus]|eukprot:CBJ26246.1 LRR-GTPase of the ROCO family, incomplete sequence [Ectocarpus siliculosus]
MQNVRVRTGIVDFLPRTTLGSSPKNLSGSIRGELGGLSKLQVLHLGVNLLDGPIPGALGALGELKELGLSNNKLSGTIPKQLGDMTKLERVWINTNKLTGSLPPQLAAPRALRLLHVQENQLTDIPRATAETFNAKPWLRDIKLELNRWKNPPWQVIQGGWYQVISFYEGLAQSGGVAVVPSLKVVLVGAVHAGKTTLTRGLLDGKLAKVPPPRTRGVDVHINPWTPNFDPAVEVVIWDFAGHDDYYSTHQLFLTSGSLHVLVVDLHKFVCDPSSTGDTVYVWLDSLLCRVPGSVVLVVATHADAFGDNRERSAAALSKLEAAINDHLKEKREEWQTAQRQAEKAKQTPQDRCGPLASGSTTGYPADHAAAPPPTLQLCGFILGSGRSLEDLSVLGRKIWEIANEASLFPDIHQTVPKSWRRVWAVMDALREGADPQKAVRLDGPLAPVEGREKREFVTREAAFEAWWGVDGESVAELKAKGPDSQQLKQDSSRLFQAALKLRQMGGSVLAACGLVHLNVAWINELLRELLDHRLADPKQAKWWVEQLKTYCHDRGVKFNRLIGIHRRFVITGMLTKEYLRFLWREVKAVQDEEVFDRLVDTMALHDAMFPCEKNGVLEEGEFMVPARLPASVACASLAELENAVSQGTRMQFVINIEAGYVPPGIIPQFLGELKRRDGGISGDFVFHVSWHRGVAFMTAGQEILVRLGETCAPSQRVVEVNIAGGAEKDVYATGFGIKNLVVRLLEQRYPGLDFDPETKPTFKKGREAWQDTRAALRGDLVEELEPNLEAVLRKILEPSSSPGDGLAESNTLIPKLIDGALAKRLSSLCSDMQLDVNRKLNETTMKVVAGVEQVVQANLSNAAVAGLRPTERDILVGVAREVAILRWPIPRFVCVLPARDTRLSESDRSFEKWSTALKEWCASKSPAKDAKNPNRKTSILGLNKPQLRGLVTRELRLFFLCGQDKSLAECGPDGQGYEVKEFLDWVRKAAPAAKIGLALASIALKVCTGLAVSTDTFEAAFGTSEDMSAFVEDALSAGIEGTTSKAGNRLDRLQNSGPSERLPHAGVRGDGMQTLIPLEGFDYDKLKEVIKSFEVDRTQRDGSRYPSFDTTMNIVDRRGHGVEWAWVRNRNIDQFVGER